MGRLLRVGMVMSLGMVVGVASPASAACHAFTVSVDPAEVVEGNPVTVTVERDAAVAESSVDVSTVDGTATAGTDYEALDETADFPDGGTSQTFTVNTMEVEGDTGSRDFQVELSNPQGCDVNPNFTLGDPATVTITDTGEAEEMTEPAETEEATETEAPTETEVPTETEAPTEEATEAEDTEEPAAEELPATGSLPLALFALGLFAAAAGAGLLRRHPAR